MRHPQFYKHGYAYAQACVKVSEIFIPSDQFLVEVDDSEFDFLCMCIWYYWAGMPAQLFVHDLLTHHDGVVKLTRKFCIKVDSRTHANSKKTRSRPRANVSTMEE